VVAAKPERMEQRENFLEEFLSYQRKMALFHAEMAAMSEAWFDGLNRAQDDAHYRAAGGGGGSSGRTGTKVGSMSYSINGVEGEVIYRYNEDQDKEQIEKKIRESLDYQCKDFTTQNQLLMYFLECNTICVDVTLNGTELANAYNEGWSYLDGSASSNWNYPDLSFLGTDKEIGYTTEGLEDGFIYIASEFLENGTNTDAHEYWTYGNSWLSLKNTGYYDFNLTFGHEVGHKLDAYFINEPIYRELNVRKRTQRQFWENNRGRYYHDEYLP